MGIHIYFWFTLYIDKTRNFLTRSRLKRVCDFSLFPYTCPYVIQLPVSVFLLKYIQFYSFIESSFFSLKKPFQITLFTYYLPVLYWLSNLSVSDLGDIGRYALSMKYDDKRGDILFGLLTHSFPLNINS